MYRCEVEATAGLCAAAQSTATQNKKTKIADVLTHAARVPRMAESVLLLLEKAGCDCIHVVLCRQKQFNSKFEIYPGWTSLGWIGVNWILRVFPPVLPLSF